MGILDVHFHDSEFVFRPSMRVGPSLVGEDDKEIGAGEAGGDDRRFPIDESDHRSNRPVLGAVLLLIMVGLLIRALRDRTAS